MASRHNKLVFYKDRKREWRWKFIARNGKQICKSSEGYKRFIDCETSFWLLQAQHFVVEGAPDNG